MIDRHEGLYVSLDSSGPVLDRKTSVLLEKCLDETMHNDRRPSGAGGVSLVELELQCVAIRHVGDVLSGGLGRRVSAGEEDERTAQNDQNHHGTYADASRVVRVGTRDAETVASPKPLLCFEITQISHATSDRRFRDEFRRACLHMPRPDQLHHASAFSLSKRW